MIVLKRQNSDVYLMEGQISSLVHHKEISEVAVRYPNGEEIRYMGIKEIVYLDVRRIKYKKEE